MVTQDVIDGKTLDEIVKTSGLSLWQVRQRVLAYERLAPDAYRQMVDSLRTFLGNIAVDEVLYWRPRARTGVDIEEKKLAMAGFHKATDILIKTFGLQSQTVEIGGAGDANPHTIEEFVALCREKPEIAAMVREVARMIDEP